MATKRKVKKLAGGFDKGEFEGVDEAATRNTGSGEWARGENYGDNTTGDERVAMARAPARMASDEEVRTASKSAATPAAKRNIVTKEQLAKSGYTNLRDYMNAQQGLTRRGGGAPERVASAAKEVKSEVKAQEKANKYETPFDRMNRENRESGRDFDSIVRRLTSRKEPLPTASEHAYKKGGKTASARGDGIAQRGKTRGTMVACGGGYMKGKK